MSQGGKSHHNPHLHVEPLVAHMCAFAHMHGNKPRAEDRIDSKIAIGDNFHAHGRMKVATSTDCMLLLLMNKAAQHDDSAAELATPARL